MARRTVERIRKLVSASLAAQPGGGEAPILVAVSGGQDSICLLDALTAAGPVRPRLEVVHVDHRLRADSPADSRFVQQLAAQHGWVFHLVAADVARYATTQRIGIEEAGRRLRYQALARVAGQRRARFVATAHNADDLAETVLLNLLRGCGPSGLVGIVERQLLPAASLGPRYPELEGDQDEPLPLWRPLLGVTRQETEAYCRALGLTWRRDASNDDTAIPRNRVRHHLLPLLRSYNPSVVAALGRLGSLVADDEAELDRLTDATWASSGREEPGRVAIGWDTWVELGASRQRRLLRRAIEWLAPGHSPTYQAVEDARALLDRRSPRRRLALGGGLRLETTRQGFQIVRQSHSTDSLA